MSVNIPFGLAWNTISVSGWLLVVTPWVCWINYRHRYVGLLLLHLLLFLNSKLIVKILPVTVFFYSYYLENLHLD